MSDDLPKIGSRWRERQWIYRRKGKIGYAPNRMSNHVIQILCYNPYITPQWEKALEEGRLAEEDRQSIVYVVVEGNKRNNLNRGYGLGKVKCLSLNQLKERYREEVSE